MQQQLEHFDVVHPNVTARLADIYMKHISTLGPRIMVSGEHNYLEATDNANRVRALLLAGIRAAVLWEQLGGGRLQFLMRRKLFATTAQEMLNQM